MFLDIGIGRFRLVRECLGSFDVAVGPIRVGETLCADHPFGDVVGASGGLAAHAHHPGSVGIFILDGKMIEDIAERRSRADFPAAHAHAVFRMRPYGPVDDVQIVHMLFHDVIPG